MENNIPPCVLGQFEINGNFKSYFPFGNGNINDTFVSEWDMNGVTVRYTHQRINHKVFLRPDHVMENILRITKYIAQLNSNAGFLDLDRRCLKVIPAKDGKPYVRDAKGGWWRTYNFIDNVHSINNVSSPEEAWFPGAAVGQFQKQLASLPLPKLHETIPHFHDMKKRYIRFYDAAEKDVCGRAKDAAQEIRFIRDNEKRGAILVDAISEGLLPERICHNDTKINNILIDDSDPSVFCVIDLDTVMPGTVLFDTGDLIRTVASAVPEDEKDLSKVKLDINIFKSLLAGYLSQACEFLCPQEISLLAESGRNITQIMTLRFLTDFLEGDHYYHINRPLHNLERCRNQIALIKSMDSQWDDIITAVRLTQ